MKQIVTATRLKLEDFFDSSLTKLNKRVLFQ